VLDTPYWHIHPCETAAAMAIPMDVLRDERDQTLRRGALANNYVAIWMTMYAVPLGLPTPFQS